MADELSPAIPLPTGAIAEICRRRGVKRLAVFGSVLRRDFRSESSDVDFLVEFESRDPEPWGADLVELGEELAALLGRPVDVLEWQAVARGRNPFRRYGILSGKRLLYAA
jgi:predicted nucleotidyltransferase